MGDNTFPNLMAVMTGLNQSDAYSVCEPTKPGKLDECPFVWHDFREAGYATSYAEDEVSISTFNYRKEGFLSHHPLTIISGRLHWPQKRI